jgi:hypothetical protein
VFRVATWYDPHPNWGSGYRFRRLPVVIDPADQSSVTLDLDALGL